MKTQISQMKQSITTTAKTAGKKEIVSSIFKGGQWNVCYGELKEPPSSPKSPKKKVEHLFRVIGEKLPFSSLSAVKRHLKQNDQTFQGLYIAHDSMGCPRYIGRGNIFARLEARKKAQTLELEYYSFYVVEQKKHEREVETLLIRAAGFLLEFNSRKKRVGVDAGNVRDYEAGTLFYERQYLKGPTK
jgi:hypothetical protein